MRGFIAALALTAIAGCEEPRFEGEIDAYAPACNNRPYVTITFGSLEIECGKYHFESVKTSVDGEERLEYTEPPCVTTWADNDCDNTADYWNLSCREYDEEGNAIRTSSSSSRQLTGEQQDEYAEGLRNIGYEAARQKWIDWNAQ